MPTYEYACGACAHQWEQVQRITEAPTELCPSCGKPDAHRLISAGTNFILKGSGWYSDLYSSAKPAASESTSGEKKTETQGEAKAEKADAKTTPAAGATSSTGSSPAAESAPSAPKTPSSPASG